MAIKYHKLYEYEFTIDLADILKDIFAETGMRYVSAERDGHTLKICFGEELPTSSENNLQKLVKRKLPHFMFKGKNVKLVNQEGEKVKE